MTLDMACWSTGMKGLRKNVPIKSINSTVTVNWGQQVVKSIRLME